MSACRRFLAGLLPLLLGSTSAWAQDAPEDRGAGAVPGGTSGAVATPPAEAEPPAKPVVTEPTIEHFENAVYPPEAEKAGIQGQVILRLTIDATGAVTGAEVMEPAGHGFDEAAQAAALKFRFKPATRNGKPVAARIPFRYKFTLREAKPAEAPPPPPTTGILHGLVNIAGTKVAIVGAEVVVTGADGKDHRVVTDEKGAWTLPDLPPGKYRIRVTAAGFEPADNVESLAAGEDVGMTDRLPPVSEGIEVTVRGERPPREVTRRTVEQREIARIPGTSGDALRSIQNLPGVPRPPAIAGLLIVRGSAPGDTETYIDGAQVPLIYHFGGLSSVVPTEVLERIDFYPGNFSARFGRVQGGIVDVGLRAPNVGCAGPYGKRSTERGCFHGLVELDIINGRFMLEGPIGRNWSFLVAGRRSWIDIPLKPVLKAADAGVTTAPVYYDYQIIAETRPSKQSRLSLRWYGADDRFAAIIEDPAAEDPTFGGNLTFGTASSQGQALYTAALSPEVELRSSLAVGWNSIEFALGTFSFLLHTYPVQMRNEFAWKIAKGVVLDAGLDFLSSSYTTTIRVPPLPEPGQPDAGPFSSRPPLEADQTGTFFRPGWYLEAELQPTRRLRIVPGFRVDFARDSGRVDWSPRVVARYDIVSPTDDEATAAAGPRRLRTTAKAGFGYFHQPPEPRQTDPVFGTPGLYSNRALHYTLGVEQEFSQQVELSVEGFYKDLQRQVTAVPGVAGQEYGNDGLGYVIGLETLLKYKPDKRFFGWVAYTLSRSIRQDGPSAPEVLYEFDQTHILTMLGSYRLGRGWEFGARFRLVSGNLNTEAVRPPRVPALYSADGATYVAQQGEVNGSRLPLFHQLDVRLDKRWQFRDWRLSAYFDIWNVYNHRSIEGVQYNYNFSQRTYAAGLPILPSLGLRGEF
jgi:TonB family protein